MKKIPLKSKELNKELAQYNLSLSKKDHAVLLKSENERMIIINGQFSFFYFNNQPVPTLKYLQKDNNVQILKKITVDMGAIKFVVKGADIMRPGIVEIETGIKKDDFIVIIDVTNKKPLAVGIALMDSKEMQATTSGKVIKNIHYLGDEIWKM